ncbi:MAG: carboxymuconolactone decarboxylase family protein [Desulfobacterales bacterium]|jgi:4-carboxymuconolactone decarboxylase
MRLPCGNRPSTRKQELRQLDKDLVEKTKSTAALYFRGVTEEKPFELWQAFDKELGKELSLFITGRLYARAKIPHQTRQLITIAVLTVLDRPDELRLHIQAALNVGCPVEDIAEAIFQTFTYAGIPTVNTALKTMRSVLKEKGLWPIGQNK